MGNGQLVSLRSVPNNDDLDRWLKLDEKFWREERGQGFQILLAILYRGLAASAAK